MNFGELAVAGTAIAFGALMAIRGGSYEIGTISMMGPGYYPILIGIVTMLFGAGAIVEGMREGNEMPDVPWRAFVLVFLGVFAWAALAERFGMVPASVVLLVLTSVARRPVHVQTMVLTTGIATIAATLLFIGGFNLPLDAIRW